MKEERRTKKRAGASNMRQSFVFHDLSVPKHVSQCCYDLSVPKSVQSVPPRSVSPQVRLGIGRW
jgi:hypothetical protein